MVHTHVIMFAWRLSGQGTTGLQCCHGLEPPTLPGVEHPSPSTCPSSSYVQWLHLRRVLPLGKYFLKRVTSVVTATFLFCCFSGGASATACFHQGIRAAEGWSLHLRPKTRT